MQTELREAGLECLMDEALEASNEGDTKAPICAIAEELYSRLDACGFDVQAETVTQMLGKMVELAPTFGAINDAFVEVAPSLNGSDAADYMLFLQTCACEFYARVEDTTIEDLCQGMYEQHLRRPFARAVSDLQLQKADMRCLTSVALTADDDSAGQICAITEELTSRLQECGFDLQPETAAKRMVDKMVELAPTFGAINDAFVEVAALLNGLDAADCTLFLDSFACEFYARMRSTDVESLYGNMDDDSPQHLSRPFSQAVSDLQLQKADMRCLTSVALEALDDEAFRNIRAIAEELSSRLQACGFDIQPETAAKQMVDKMLELAPTVSAIIDRFVEVAPLLKDASPDARTAFLDSFACQFYACVNGTTVVDLWHAEERIHYPILMSFSRPFDQVVRDLQGELHDATVRALPRSSVLLAPLALESLTTPAVGINPHNGIVYA
jgi:L-rhamnose mutarotase